jgi:hypothetical protein
MGHHTFPNRFDEGGASVALVEGLVRVSAVRGAGPALTKNSAKISDSIVLREK